MFGGLRSLVLKTNLAVHGVPATVTRPAPNDTPIDTSVIWLTPGLSQPTTDAVPSESGLQRREVQRVLAVSLAVVPELPRGTLIEAPEPSSETVRTWMVDGTELADSEQRRVFVTLVE